MDVIPTTVVLEVLNKYNYEDWSEVVKSYLIARNLWDVVKPDDQDLVANQDDHVKPEPQESGNDRKNAAALHAIKISCGPEALQEIRGIYSAKDAWKALEHKFKPGFRIQLFPWQGASTAENKDGNTPKQVFTKSHKALSSEGEKWMKEMATSCTVVAVLIVTMVFTAAFTIPGGTTNKKLKKSYLISIAMAFFSSTASVLVFLGILTSRYNEDDFLVSLPTKLFLGLSTLFFSIASMLIAFCARLLIMLPESWVPIPVILLAALPVALFAYMQFPLLIRTFRYTYLKSLSLTVPVRWKTIRKLLDTDV